MPMKRYRRFFRPVLFFSIFLLLAWKKITLWVGFLILSIFYFAVDVYSADKRKAQNESTAEEYSGPLGILGHHVIDATESYGLFIKLLNSPVFVDIRRDEFLEQREQRASYLFKHQKELENNLTDFMTYNPEFKGKKISYIGLHSDIIDQGEVFWSPEGYTLISGISFLPDTP
jgi:hypothetical protein